MGYSTASYCVQLVLCVLVVANNISSSYAKKPGRLRGLISNNNTSVYNKVDRDGKSISLPFMAYVTFPQDQCKSDSGDTGVCMKKSACSLNGGTASGSCAFSYGTCCIIKQECTEDIGTVRVNGTKLTQGSTYVDLCRYEIPKQKDVCQIRLDFTEFMIDEGPNAQDFGDCVTDTLTISGYSNAQIGPLCGNLNGQHMYLDYGSNDKIALDLFLNMDMSQRWNIMVTMIKCDSREKAPPGCFQYFTTQRGMIKSLNYNLMHQLNNQDYSVCVRANQGMKNIKWTTCGGGYDFFITDTIALPAPPATEPVIGTPKDGTDCMNDWVMIFGANKYCGSAFPESVSVMSQPFMLQVHMNAFELAPPIPCIPVPPGNSCPGPENPDDRNAGFCLSYQQTPY